MSNGKHIAVDVIAFSAVLMWKPKEIAKTLLNPVVVHHDGYRDGKL